MNKGDLPLMYSFVFWCEFIKFIFLAVIVWPLTFSPLYEVKAQVAQAWNMNIGERDVTYILCKVSCFLNPFIFVGYKNDRFFLHTNPHISNVTHQGRCSAMFVFPASVTCDKRSREKQPVVRTLSTTWRGFAARTPHWIADFFDQRQTSIIIAPQLNV